jgi:hypothetical protein
MQLERFVRTLALLLGLGLVGSMGGCGPGTQQASTASQEERVKSIIGGAHRKLEQERKASITSKGGGKKQRKGGL